MASLNVVPSNALSLIQAYRTRAKLRDNFVNVLCLKPTEAKIISDLHG